MLAFEGAYTFKCFTVTNDRELNECYSTTGGGAPFMRNHRKICNT